MCLSLYLFSCVEGELTDTYPGRVLCAQKSFEVDPNEPNVTVGSVQQNFGAVGIINWVKMTFWIFFASRFVNWCVNSSECSRLNIYLLHKR